MTNSQLKSLYTDDILNILKTEKNKDVLLEKLSNFHERDIAEAIELLSIDERKEIYPRFNEEYLAEIISYIDNPADYIEEISKSESVKIISEMDSDDVIDVIEELDEKSQQEVIASLDEDISKDVKLILSFSEDEIGSKMTTNFIKINKDLSIKQATLELIEQAGENDNITTLYVVDDNNKFFGAIDLKDLIIARSNIVLADLIYTSYPYFFAKDKITDVIESLKGYAEDSLPILSDDKTLLGVITAHDVVEVVNDELSEDYAKLAGLTSEEDLNEKTLESMKKRLPWLITLLILGLGVSSVVGVFETVVAVLPIIICFQSLILDMAGNVGTQSLAVTIRVLMNEDLNKKDLLNLCFKEIKVGLTNGLVLGLIAFIFVGLYVVNIKGLTYVNSFCISGCVGIALLLSMTVSSFVGTVIPIIFQKLKVDPAVASGPLITTVNDLVAVITYYGLSWLFLIKYLAMANL